MFDSLSDFDVTPFIRYKTFILNDHDFLYLLDSFKKLRFRSGSLAQKKSLPGVRVRLVTWLACSLLVVNLDVRWLAPRHWVGGARRRWKRIRLPQKNTFTPSSKKTSQEAANSEEKLAFERRLSNMALTHTKKRRTHRLSSPGHRTNEALHSPTAPDSEHGLHVICPSAFCCVHALVDTHRQKTTSSGTAFSTTHSIITG